MDKVFAIGFLLIANKLVCAFDHYRIVGGSRASITDHPYMAIIWVNAENQTIQLCGGAILNNRYILTASHCVKDIRPKELSVTVGATFANHRDGKTYKVAKTKTHEKYNEDSLHNDIGLIKIIGSFRYSNKVQKIAVAARGFELPTGTKCVITGWGATLVRSTTQLKRAIVPIVEPRQCAVAYSQINNITDKMICCGYSDGHIDTCQGDSGGPLVYRDQLVGIVSFGVGCARPETPGIYTKISKYTEWLIRNAV